MGIVFNEDNKLFHIQSKRTSYILSVLETGHLINLYWGRKINSNKINYVVKKRACGSFLADLDNIDALHLEVIAQEYPSYGNPDLRSPAIQVKLANGTTVTDFRYESHEIYRGKKKLEGLPATYAEKEDEVESLEITLKDEVANLRVILSYTVFENYDSITRSCKVINDSNDEVDILRALSANVDFTHSEFDLIQLSGSWARERHIVRTALRSGGQCIESRRGASSHAQNPFIALVSKDATEDKGEVYGFNLIYSGNFLASVEVDMHSNARTQIGINPFDFTWNLESGQSFQTPEVVMVYSPNGLTGMSHIYHDLYRERLCRGAHRDKERPILINNWEATYFDFNNEKIKEIAKESSKLGIELFVLDDGWFGERNNDDCSLGDWFVNEEKLKGGLNSLATDINKMGMQFGLWFEPEMISPNSDLFREHPDWCIHIEGREPALCREQYVLDLSRQEVVDYIYESIKKVLSSANITYVKWDMNRQLTDLGSLALSPEKHGELFHRYMLAVYEMMDRLTTDFPHILLENCSGGGARFDPGMLYYSPQIWCSDDTDAIERLKIQEGTSMVYPLSVMGAHVSDCPNHTVGRTTPFETRGHVALAGTFGYELDVTRIPEKDREMIPSQVKMYHKYNDLIRRGDYYRIENFSENHGFDAWEVVSKDKNEVLVTCVQVLGRPNYHSRRIKLKGLVEDKMYKVEESGEVISGGALMYAGINVYLYGDYSSKLIHLTAE